MPLPSKRDHAAFGRRLAAWLAERLPAGAAPEIVDLAIPEGTGMSSETLLFTATWTEDGARRSRRYVARIRPEMTDHPVFPEYDLELQHRCLELVAARSEVPVPEAPFLELDEAPLGAPFFLMHRVDGVVPADVPPYVFGGWLLDATPEERATLQRNAVQVLADLHAIDVTGPDAAFLDRPQWGATPLDQHLAYQRWYYEWAREGRSSPLIERTFAHLEAHRPAQERTVLNWGDARIGNIMWRDFAPVAVLDWEMAAIGAPGVDISWMIFLHRFFHDMATKYGMPGMPDFLRREDVARQYEELSGHPATDLEYYEIFAALRFAIVSLRTSIRAIAYGDMVMPEDPEDLIMHRSLLEAMLDGSYFAS
jgi:aminoglycoside phosphotransferase (APT) family kinase protein